MFHPLFILFFFALIYQNLIHLSIHYIFELRLVEDRGKGAIYRSISSRASMISLTSDITTVCLASATTTTNWSSMSVPMPSLSAPHQCLPQASYPNFASAAAIIKYKQLTIALLNTSTQISWSSTSLSLLSGTDLVSPLSCSVA